MNKKDLARKRNWEKRKLMGITINEEILTDKEKRVVGNIKDLVKYLLDGWDVESAELGLFPLPVYVIEGGTMKFTTKSKKEMLMYKELGYQITEL